MEPTDPTQEKKRRALGGPLASWVKKRAEKQRLADMAKSIASSVAGRLVATALAAGFIGGAVAEQAIPDRVPEVIEQPDLSGHVAAVEALASGLEQDVAFLNSLAEDLNKRIGALATALSAGQSVTASDIRELQTDLTNLAQDIGVAEGMIDGHARDLSNLVVNQNTLGVRSEQVDRRLAVVDAGLDTVAVIASTARARAIEAVDLARAALDRSDAVAEDVAALADQVDALASAVADQASKLDLLADEVGGIAAAVDALQDRVGDLEDRMDAEEAEQPTVIVQGDEYDDSELRGRIESLEERIFDLDALERHTPITQTVSVACTTAWTNTGVAVSHRSGDGYISLLTGSLSGSDPIDWTVRGVHNDGSVRYVISGSGNYVMANWTGNSLYVGHRYQILCSRAATFAGSNIRLRTGEPR